MKYFLNLLFFSWLLSLLLPARPAAAQQPTPPSDVLLLTTGQEVRGRVLTITPTELTYRPAPDSAHPAGRSDTLRLPSTSVFLVRYANGTRAVLTPAPPTPAPDTAQSPLLGLSAGQRQQRGAQDARRYYHQSGPFWGAFASAILVTPIYGVVPTTCISLKHVAARNLMAPQPELLRDPAYASGYQRQANRRKAGRTWAGYGVGSAVLLTYFAVVIIGLTSGH